ncbi:uncharacterized protein BDV17DRAFT_244595 [Aspergillus undulatus]|uniref:uncharacterized protein n=1 Tax=Aspergillus undulatus TaxID=1810928 RepID=UPI003CCDAA71
MYSHWPCPYCFEDQKSPEDLKGHLSITKPRCKRATPVTESTEDGEHDWKCPVRECGKSYDQRNSLLRHYHWHIRCNLTCVCGRTLHNLRSLELHLDKCQAVQSPDDDSSARANQIQGEKSNLRKRASSELASAFAERQHLSHAKKRKTSSLSSLNFSAPCVSNEKLRSRDINDAIPLNDSNAFFTDLDLLNLDGFMFGAHLWSEENFVVPEF